MARRRPPGSPSASRQRIEALVDAVIAAGGYNQRSDAAARELHAISGYLGFLFARRLAYGPRITPQAREELVTSYMISAQRAAGEHPAVPAGFSDYTPPPPNRAERRALERWRKKAGRVKTPRG